MEVTRPPITAANGGDNCIKPTNAGNTLTKTDSKATAATVFGVKSLPMRCQASPKNGTDGAAVVGAGRRLREALDGMGCHGVRVGTRSELKAALNKAMAARGKFQLIEITLPRGVLSNLLARFVAGVKWLNAAK